MVTSFAQIRIRLELARHAIRMRAKTALIQGELWPETSLRDVQVKSIQLCKDGGTFEMKNAICASDKAVKWQIYH